MRYLAALVLTCALAGASHAHIAKDSFGNLLSDTNPALNCYIGFAGGLEDRDTGLVLFGYRNYLPDIGRWIEKDPLLLEGGDLDFYAYCGQDPINRRDPLGLFVPALVVGAEILLTTVPTMLGAMHAASTLNNPCASGGEKAASVALAAAGVFMPVGSAGRAARATGAFRDGVAGGTGLGRLAGLELRVSQRGLDLVERHLAQFGDVPENAAMVARLRGALSSGTRISGADASFYMHEAAEATMMARGLAYEQAHAAALGKYNVSPYSVYHPDVIRAIPEAFNGAWRSFWGM